MDNQQIAHELAIAKLYGSVVPVDRLVEQYRQDDVEINDYLKSQSKPSTAKVIQNPFRG